MMIRAGSIRVVGAALLAFALATVSVGATAHEFWISPQDGKIESGDKIVGDLKVGPKMQGAPYPYLPNRFQFFTVTIGDTTTMIAGNIGDIPALSYVTNRSGLHVIAQHTIAFRVTYSDGAVFQRYLADEGLEGIAERHRARGLPDSGFAERYTRCAKALVQVGPVNSADRDIRVGMPLELVAEANPYASELNDLPVTLTWQGAPVADRQITIWRDDGAITRTIVTTDKAGRALIPLSGKGEYLLNAVYLLPADAPPVFWASHWATLSFKL